MSLVGDTVISPVPCVVPGIQQALRFLLYKLILLKSKLYELNFKVFFIVRRFYLLK